MNGFEPVIGLEVHIQLKTMSKLFCGCPTAYGAEPNTQVCPVRSGYPGTLPVLNRKAVEYAIKMALAIGGNINRRSRFARKNYFYPDLPKGYQISQYEHPLAKGGAIAIKDDAGQEKKIRIARIHLEEEAGKSIYDRVNNRRLLDFNRCGIPLIEIVTLPDMSSAGEAYRFLSRVKQIAEYLDITSGNMNEGALRCDVNISIIPRGDNRRSARHEIKNMNSFKFARQAIKHEIKKQVQIIKRGGKVTEQTMLWDEKRRVTRPMRSKEIAADYRYFPEPDLPMLEVSADWIAKIKQDMPELPVEKQRRFTSQYKITPDAAEVLTSTKELADYYEAVVRTCGNARMAANWVMTKILHEQKSDNLIKTTVRPEYLGQLISMVDAGEISGKTAGETFAEMSRTGRPPQAIIKTSGRWLKSDKKALAKIVEKVLNNNRKEIEKYLAGKTEILNYFIGRVMEQTDGCADPQAVSSLLRKALAKRRGR